MDVIGKILGSKKRSFDFGSVGELRGLNVSENNVVNNALNKIMSTTKRNVNHDFFSFNATGSPGKVTSTPKYNTFASKDFQT